jgi:hypothetical protein
MIAPRVFNKQTDNVPSGVVYIGRGSKWWPPGEVMKDCSKGEMVSNYRTYMLKNPALLAEAKRELKGKHVLCFCSPDFCHGDVLIELVN